MRTNHTTNAVIGGLVCQPFEVDIGDVARPKPGVLDVHPDSVRCPMDSLQRHPMLGIHAECLATIVNQLPPISPWIGMQLKTTIGKSDLRSYLVLLCHVFPVFSGLAIPSPRPELQRLRKFHLALIPTLQQGHLVNVDVCLYI